ncbi:MAG: type II secretion system F family protein [Acidimicrobiia bacterium]
MTGLPLLVAAFVGLACAGVAATFLRPTARLAPRVRPYTIVARTSLGRSADVLAVATPSSSVDGNTLTTLFGPPLLALAKRFGRLVESRSDEHLALRLRHAGHLTTTPDEYRLRQLGQATAFAALGGVVGAVVLHSGAPALLLGVCGAVVGATRWKGKIDAAIVERRERIRSELYTVNQLLALHLRTGAGPVQATQRIADRGRGAVVEELSEVLVWIRSGMAESDAFRRAAELTPEPSAARTYRLFATGAERGVDLAAALLQLSEDIRDARREDLRKSATKRRAAMLVPTIAILAPIMILFIAAPIPSIVFGMR